MKIKLADFDHKYYSSLKDKDSIIPPSINTIYHIIEVDGLKAGIVGYIPIKNDTTIGFVQIILIPEYRGKGIIKIAEEMLVKKYKIKKLYATIKEQNIASIKAHKKYGFVEEKAEIIEKLRKQGYLKRDQIRFYKYYS